MLKKGEEKVKGLEFLEYRDEFIERVNEHQAEGLLHFQSNQNRSMSLRVSTRVGGHLWWKRYLPVVDCDTEEEKNWAQDYLIHHHDEIFVIWKSTPSEIEDVTQIQVHSSRYWIIVDKPLRMKDCVKFMQQIPGNDVRYVDNSENRNMVVLRAFPRNGYIPELVIERGYASKMSKEFLIWHKAFSAWWSSGTVKCCRTNYLLQTQREQFEEQKRREEHERFMWSSGYREHSPLVLEPRPKPLPETLVPAKQPCEKKPRRRIEI